MELDLKAFRVEVYIRKVELSGLRRVSRIKVKGGAQFDTARLNVHGGGLADGYELAWGDNPFKNASAAFVADSAS